MQTNEVFSQRREDLFKEAATFLSLFHEEVRRSSVPLSRFHEVQEQCEQTGTYWQTEEELQYGTMLAWRNNSRCIGRLHWQSLQVHDRRALSTAEEIFTALIEYMRLATNGGKLRLMAMIFAPQLPGQPGIRIWNPQLIRYAGYRQANGAVLGDPLHVELTEAIRQLGWQGGEGTPFDILPIIIQMPHEPPRMFELPREVVLEVPLYHPEYPWFEELGLKWHALPAITNMRLEIGGVSYTAAPFNGWYMSTEVGVRNLGDDNRYNLLPVIADKMHLSTHSNRSLWKDRALIELNRAVLYSFARRGVVMVDHHTAAHQFILHEEREKLAGRCTPADWGWIVPPISGSATPVFHRPYEDVLLKPNFFYQPEPWKELS
ncbi:MAG TPA: nitric oxide synthase oxygenase [Ktedonobacteraceae bacterium]|nr:nitric oxide synthase oxygenase [Ktedonobacteraceae bacterium]